MKVVIYHLISGSDPTSYLPLNIKNLYPVAVMTNEELLKEIASLPAEAKRQIERFIALLKKRQSSVVSGDRKKSFREEKVFGMWKDREDMKEGGAVWVRNLRDTQWKR